MVGNALDAMSSGGVLRVRARLATNWETSKPEVRITIADNGCGMNAKTKEQIYKPFLPRRLLSAHARLPGLFASRDVARRTKPTPQPCHADLAKKSLHLESDIFMEVGKPRDREAELDVLTKPAAAILKRRKSPF
jgi:hypothetical protein